MVVVVVVGVVVIVVELKLYRSSSSSSSSSRSSSRSRSRSRSSGTTTSIGTTVREGDKGTSMFGITVYVSDGQEVTKGFHGMLPQMVRLPGSPRLTRGTLLSTYTDTACLRSISDPLGIEVRRVSTLIEL